MYLGIELMIMAPSKQLKTSTWESNACLVQIKKYAARDYARGTCIKGIIRRSYETSCTIWLRIVGRGLPKLQKQTVLRGLSIKNHM